MSKHHTEHSTALIDHHKTSHDNHVEQGNDRDQGALGWAEKEAADCWKGTCNTASGIAKIAQDGAKLAKEKFEQQPEWAKILEGGAVVGLVVGGVAQKMAVADAEANQAFQNGLKSDATQEIKKSVGKVSGEGYVGQTIKHGDGSTTSHLLDPDSAAGRKALQNGMSEWKTDKRQH